MSTGELACTYACLILHDDGIAVTAEKIGTLAKAAKVDMESYWPSLFAKLCEKKSIDELIVNIGTVGGGAPMAAAAPAASAAAAAPAAEEKKEESEESDAEGSLMDLFG